MGTARNGLAASRLQLHGRKLQGPLGAERTREDRPAPRRRWLESGVLRGEGRSLWRRWSPMAAPSRPRDAQAALAVYAIPAPPPRNEAAKSRRASWIARPWDTLPMPLRRMPAGSGLCSSRGLVVQRVREVEPPVERRARQVRAVLRIGP